MKTSFIRRTTAAIVICGFLAAWTAGPAAADVTISVAPSLVEARATPGGQGSQELTVYNDGTEAFQATTSIQQYKDGAADLSAIDWLRVEPQTVDLAPGSRAAVKVTISVPSSLESGGRYAMVTFTTGAKATGTGAGVSAQLGVPFLITVNGSGGIAREGSLDRILPVLEPTGKVGFRALLVNRGNVHIASRGGTLEVTGANLGPAGRLSFPESTSILPRGEELLVANGSVGLQPNARYQARGNIQLGDNQRAGMDTSFAARAAMAALSLSGSENANRGPSLQLNLRNDGELGLSPRVQFEVRDGAGALVGSVAPQKPPLLWPGQSTIVEALYPGRLLTGEYSVTSRADYGVGAPLVSQGALRVGAPAPPTNTGWGAAPERSKEPVSSPIRMNWLLLAIGAAALTLALMLGGAIRRLPSLSAFRRRSIRAVKVLRGAE